MGFWGPSFFLSCWHHLWTQLSAEPSGPAVPRMSFLNFLRQFSQLEICNLSPDSLSNEEVHK